VGLGTGVQIATARCTTDEQVLCADLPLLEEFGNLGPNPANFGLKEAWRCTTGGVRHVAGYHDHPPKPAGFPGREVCNAAIAASLATARILMITPRSTPASAAAAAWVIWTHNRRTHQSYFCSAVKNRFGSAQTPSAKASSAKADHPVRCWVNEHASCRAKSDARHGGPAEAGGVHDRQRPDNTGHIRGDQTGKVDIA
jgi:hypothetical protein